MTYFKMAIDFRDPCYMGLDYKKNLFSEYATYV